MTMIYRISFLNCRSVLFVVCLLLFIGCRYPMPEAPLVERCVINLDSGNEICYKYKIDVFGGFSDPESEIRRPITNRSICFPVDEWIEIALWRDELVQWSEDVKSNNNRRGDR